MNRVSRNDDLWPLLAEFGRLVQTMKPELVTMENVPQLVHHPVFTDFVNMLRGYYVTYTIVECAQYGVPQTRKRLVLLASSLGQIEIVPPAKHKPQPTVRAAISCLQSLEAGQGAEKDPLHSACALSELNLRRIRASKPGGTWRDWPKELLSPCHTKQSGSTFPSVYGRMRWDEPSPTITTQCFGFGNGRFGHPDQNRAITLREAATLQTFPTDYKFIKPGEPVRYQVHGRLIGNVVTVKIGEMIADSFIAHLAALR